MHIFDYLESKCYKKKIYLNDRPYYIVDKGEGDCNVLLVDKSEMANMERIITKSLSRTIVVDLSLAWGSELRTLCEEKKSQLAEDIHLLMDVFWLDELTIQSTIKELDIKNILGIVKTKQHYKELFVAK